MEYGVLDLDDARAAVIGGAVLGGGGGGSPQMGMELAELAVRVGRPRLVPIQEVDPSATLLTVGLVGAPAAVDRHVKPVDFVRAAEMALHALDLRREDLGGLITNENGATATVNGWLQAALLDVPVVDAPSNGRAHPTGLMGALGLDRISDYEAVQTAAGGNPQKGLYMEMTVRGDIRRCASLVRQAAVEAGGLVAVCRNPVAASWVAEKGAPGAISQAIALGQAILAAHRHGVDLTATGERAAHAAADFLDGEVTAMGTVTQVSLETRGGFDIGTVVVAPYNDEGATLELTFWNEFMTCEANGRRLATFPDLVALIDSESGNAVTTAEVRTGLKVAVLLAPQKSLRLGAGMYSPELMAQAEAAVGKSLGL